MAETSSSRRQLLKTGAVATGVAYAAPQILNTAVAGAQTQTCYAFSITGSNRATVCSALAAGPSDPDCDAAFNAALQAAANSGGQLVTDCADPNLPAVSFTSGGSGVMDATIVVDGDGCVFTFAGLVTEGRATCAFAPDPSVSIVAGGKSATFASPTTDNIDRLIVVVCCTGSP